MKTTIARPFEPPPVSPLEWSGWPGKKKILAVDDSSAERMLLSMALRSVREYDVLAVADGQTALDQIEKTVPDAVILDMKLPAMSGLEVLKELKKNHPLIPVIMLTGLADVRMAVEAIKAGAHNYLTKPFESDQLILTLSQAMERNEMIAKMEELSRQAGRRGPALSQIVGDSPAIESVKRQIQQVADSSLTVLIQGETGAGKEAVARALHEESSRRDKPFVAIDCGALPENLLESELFGHEKGAFSGADRRKQGQIELAQGGTLFLDEIGNLGLSLQAKLLRVLEERQMRPVGAAMAFAINVRFIAASNAQLSEEAKLGRFRQDLYYRLAEFTLHLPPLRYRMEDIFPLAQRFREKACVEFQKQVTTLSKEAEDLLMSHSWPGNIRELRNVIRQAVLLTPDSEIHAEQVQALLGNSSSLESPGPVAVPFLPGQALRKIVEKAAEEVEKQAIVNVLRSTKGNKSQAAKLLEVDYKTLRLKIKKYNLPVSEE